MKTINPSQTVIVFDLDDTLYAEHEYKLSGIQAVVETVAALYPEFDTQTLLANINRESNGWLDDLCRHCGFNQSEKQTLLWQYRLHTPDLTPYMPAEALSELTRTFVATALISDGRSLTQRLKLKSLGFMELFDEILISEDWQSEKPDDKRFKYIEEQYRSLAKQFIYIGDNIKKDFVTPNKMGWITIGLSATALNIHQHHPDDFPQENQPHYWIRSLRELNQNIHGRDIPTT